MTSNVSHLMLNRRRRRPRTLRYKLQSDEEEDAPISDLRETESQSDSRDLSPLSIVPTSISKLLPSARERRGFEFFFVSTIHQLSGNLESGVWAQYLLQAAQLEPSVLHAAVALGALHQSNESSKIGQDTFATKQYVKAIGYLVKPLNKHGKQAADVALLTCILFIYFENLRGHHGAAISHIDGGIRILSSLQNPEQPNSTLLLSSSPYVPISDLSLIFGRLDGQAGTIVRDWDRGKVQPSCTSGLETIIPAVFPSLEAAYTALDLLRINGVCEIDQAILKFGKGTQKTNFTLGLIKTSLQVKVKLWRQALDRFVQYHQPLDQDTLNGLHILKMWRLVIEVSLAALGDSDIDCCWDPYTHIFERILAHAKAVIATDQKTTVLAMDIGLILPLYFTAHRCRDGRVRRRAIELMRSSHRQEGIYNSHLTARMAERLVDMEEAGLIGTITPHDIPKAKRVAGIDTRFDKDGKRALLRYQYAPTPAQQQNMILGGTTGLEEWIEW